MAQSPTPDVPVEANATWYSSQPNIVEITPDGIIKNLNIGQTTLTLEVKIIIIFKIMSKAITSLYKHRLASKLTHLSFYLRERANQIHIWMI